MYVYLYVYICICIYTYIYVFGCVHIHTHIHMYMNVCVCISIHICIRMYICMYIYIYIYTHLRVYTQTPTQTQILLTTNSMSQSLLTNSPYMFSRRVRHCKTLQRITARYNLAMSHPNLANSPICIVGVLQATTSPPYPHTHAHEKTFVHHEIYESHTSKTIHISMMSRDL